MQNVRKRTLALLLTLVMAFTIISGASTVATAAGNPYPQYNYINSASDYQIACTWYAWKQANERLGLNLPAWGNGGNWYGNAGNSGYSRGSTARANSIACWAGTASNSWGHVAYVTGVNGNGSINIVEGGSGWPGNSHGICSRTVSPGQYWPDQGFIYLQPTDTTPPTISNVQVTNRTVDGYTVTCTVSDNVGVTKVQFPTWTAANGQDDLIWHTGTISGSTASFRVLKSEHKNEGESYITDIYAWDAAGNTSACKSVWVNMNAYTVSYNANGGSGAPGSQTKLHDVNLTLSVLKPQQTGFTFKSWNTKADGSGTGYAPGATYKTEAAVTLYAQWTANSYTVTFNPNGGTCSVTSKAVTYGKPYGDLPTPTRAGFTFDGWYRTPNGLGIITSKSSVSAADNHSLYAQWTKIPAALTSITVKTMPTKTVYETGEKFSASGLTLTAEYADGVKQTVSTGYTCTGFSSDMAGTKTITVTYDGQTTTFTVTVNGPTVTIASFRSERTEYYNTSMLFYAGTQKAPANATVHWFVNGQDVGTGTQYAVRYAKADYTTQAKLIDSSGKTIAESEIETVHIRQDIWSRLRALILWMLGADYVTEQREEDRF